MPSDIASRSASTGRPLRLAVISYRLPIPGVKRGGIERVAHDLAQGLSRAGHEVTVWSYDRGPLGCDYEVRPLPFRRFAESWLGHRLTMGYLGNAFSLFPDFSRADAVIAMGDSLLLPLARRPVVRVMHGSALGEAMSASSPFRIVLQVGVYVQELLTGLLQPGTVAVSENTRRHNPFVRRVIPNGVDLRAFEPSPTKSTDPTILFVGALEGRKRGALLLDWFRLHVLPEHPRAQLVMVGSPGPIAEGVSYRTGISDEELSDLYRAAWVYASPSRYEGFGLPYIEAMASGTPVLATPNPGSREVLADGQYGVLAADDEFPAMLNRLLRDENFRDEMRAKGLERAREYSLNTMIERYERLLLELCDEREATANVGHA